MKNVPLLKESFFFTRNKRKNDQWNDNTADVDDWKFFTCVSMLRHVGSGAAMKSKLKSNLSARGKCATVNTNSWNCNRSHFKNDRKYIDVEEKIDQQASTFLQIYSFAASRKCSCNFFFFFFNGIVDLFLYDNRWNYVLKMC